MKYDIIVVGASAAGLSATKEPAETGYHVYILETVDNALQSGYAAKELCQHFKSEKLR